MPEPSSVVHFRVLEAQWFERPVRLRLPFRFGMVTLTEAPQAFLRLRVVDARGRTAEGMGAEMLVPKWFEKDAARSLEGDVERLRQSVRHSLSDLTDRPVLSMAKHAAASYQHASTLLNEAVAGDKPLSGLAARYGSALVERATADAVCRLAGLPFHSALRQDVFGLADSLSDGGLGALVPDLSATALAKHSSRFVFSTWLANLQALPQVALRHTLGLLDELRGSHTPDGLPATLEAVLRAQQPPYLKVKLGGDTAQDLARLSELASLLVDLQQSPAITLDGNEQFPDWPALQAAWQAFQAEPKLVNLLKQVLWVEQPISRANALAQAVPQGLPPIVMDESDDSLDAWPRAQALGYRGVSSKCCKSWVKSVLNAARIARDNLGRSADQALVMSAEDLTTQAGLGVQQDLALISSLGITHVERNGHHYVDGFASTSPNEQQTFAAAHPDLYTASPDTKRVRLRVQQGSISVASIHAAVGFGSAVHPVFLNTAARVAATNPSFQ